MHDALAPKRCMIALDGIVKDSKRIASATYLQKFLSSVAEKAGMTVLNITTSYIKEDLNKLGAIPFEDEGGISVQALISTSHIAIHTWRLSRTFMFDLVSCRKFDYDMIEKFVVKSLGVDKIIYRATDGVEVSLRIHPDRLTSTHSLR